MAKRNQITYDINFTTNADDLFKKITAASSKSGKAMEKELGDALNHAQKNLQEYAEMQKKVLSGSQDISKPVYEQARKVAKASSEFLKVYNNSQTSANKVSEELTTPYKALEEELQKTIALNNKLTSDRERARTNVKYIQDVEAYENNRKAIEAVLEEEAKYQKRIEDTNKSLNTRVQNLKENNDRYNEWKSKNPTADDKDNPYEFKQVQTDRWVRGWATAIDNMKNKIAELRAPYDDIINRYTIATEQLRKRGIEPTTESIQHEILAWYALGDEVKQNEATIHQLKQSQQDLVNTQGKFEHVGLAPEQIARLRELASNMAAVQMAAQNGADGMERMKNSTNSSAGATKSLASRFHELGNAIKKVFSHHSRLRHSNRGFFEDTKRGVRNALRNIMRYGLGVRSLYFLFRRLRRIVKESFKAMASQVSEVNDQISQMVTSWNAVKGSVATMFQPLLNVIMPAFVNAMTSLQAIMERVAIFFATLTGQGYIYRATAQTADWANELGKVKKTLLGIDELNVIDKDEGGNSSWTDSISYEQIPIAANEFAQKLKEAWINEDFGGLGEILGDKLNSMLLGLLNKLPAIQTLGRTIATRIAEAINGFMSTPDLATNIGATIAGVLNLAVNTVGAFIGTFNWTSLGKFILDAINGVLTTFDWTKAVWNVAQLVNALTSTIYTIISDKKTWSLLGYKLGVGIDTFAKTYHWENLGKTVFSLITGVFNFLSSAIKAIDFQAIGQAVVNIFKEIDWGALVWSFGNLWETLAEKVVEGFATLDFTGLLSKKIAHVKEVEAGMAAYDYGEESIEAKNAEKTAKYWRDRSDSALGFWQKLGNSISGLWNDTLDAMWQMSNPMLPDNNSAYEESGKNASDGYLNGFHSGNIPGETGKIMSDAIDAVRTVNDSHSPSRVYKKLGQDVIDGFMLPFKSGFIGQFTSVWQSLAQAIRGPINNMITYLNRFIEAVQTMQNSVADAFNTFNFDVPDVLGGGRATMSLTRWTAPKIPYLAQGAVIPPNNQFLAMLGDQKQGTNVEAPLSTIQEAVANVLEPYLRQIANNTQVLTEKDYATYIGDREIAMANSRGSKQLGLALIK